MEMWWLAHLKSQYLPVLSLLASAHHTGPQRGPWEPGPDPYPQCAAGTHSHEIKFTLLIKLRVNKELQWICHILKGFLNPTTAQQRPLELLDHKSAKVC